MRNRQNALLSGIAAIALISTTGLALAQSPAGQSKDKPAAAASSAAPSSHAMQPSGAVAGPHAQPQGNMTGGMSQREQKSGPATAQSGKESETAAQKPAGFGTEKSSATTGSEKDRSAENAQRGYKAPNRMSQDQNRQDREIQNQAHNKGRNEIHSSQRDEHRGRISEERRETKGSATATMEQRGRTSTAGRSDRNKPLSGLQANTALPMSGENVHLTDQQRSSVRETVIEGRNAPRVGHVDFDVRVGSMVPRRHVHIVPVPETLVQIDPEWRGYLYFVYEDEVVIVNPRDMRIVAVLDV